MIQQLLIILQYHVFLTVPLLFKLLFSDYVLEMNTGVLRELSGVVTVVVFFHEYVALTRYTAHYVI